MQGSLFGIVGLYSDYGAFFQKEVIRVSDTLSYIPAFHAGGGAI